MKKEYIYIRTHRDWDTDGVCKLGRTECIPDRESTYITGEFVAGIMEMVIEVPQNKSKIIGTIGT